MTFEEIKEELRARCDVVDVINGYVPLKRAGANHVACCPFHQEKTPSFNVNSSKQMFHCFGCGKGGDIFTFVMEYEGVDFIGALRILARVAGIPFEEEELRSGGNFDPVKAKVHRDKKEVLYDLHERLVGWYQSNLRSEAGREALAYVRKRGLTDDLMVTFGIGYAPDSWDACCQWGSRQGIPYEAMLDAGVLKPRNPDRPEDGAYDLFRNRLMFPITNPQGHTVGFSGRALAEDSGPKYLNTPATLIFDKSSVLYGLSLARQGIRERGYALLCEGQMDVIACHGAGFTNAVAPQGTAFTEQQARQLKRHTEQLVICFDTDNAGIHAAMRSVEIFVPAGLSAKVVLLGEGEDPDSLVRTAGPEALQARIEVAQDFFEFLLDCLIREHDPATPQGKGEIAAAYLQAISNIENMVTRAEYCRRLADRLGVPEDYVFQQLNGIVNRHKRTQHYRQQQHRSQQEDAAPAASATPPATEESVTEKAEADLLDIALNHQDYARRLFEEVPREYISEGEVGKALNLCIALTAQGEWEDCEDALRESLAAKQVPAISRILVAPQYGRDAAPKRLAIAYRDCRKRLIDNYFAQELSILGQELARAADLEEKNRVMRTILEMKMRQRQMVSAAPAPVTNS